MVTSLGFSQNPSTGPTNPIARNAWDVKSLYGGAYTNEAGVVFDSFGGSTIDGDVTLGDGNIVKKYSNHLYSGIQAGAGNLDVTAMTKLHIDVYSPGFTSFRIKLEAVNGSNVELDVPGAHVQGSWNSFDLDLSAYSGVDLAHLKWVVPVSYTPPGETLYIDNVYFYRPATTVAPPTLSNFSFATRANGSTPFTITAPTSNSTGAFSYISSNTSVATISGNTITITGVGSTFITATQAAAGSYASGSISATLAVTPPAAPSPTAPAASIIALYTDAYPTVEPATVDTFLTSWSAASLTPIVISTNNTLNYTNVNFLGIEATSTPINATSMNLFHIDIYTPNMTTFRVKLVDFGANGTFGGGDDVEQELSMTPTLNGWNSYNLLLSSFTGLTTRGHIAQIILSGNPAGSGTLYVDNMYFSSQTLSVAPTLSNFTIPTKQVGNTSFAVTAPTSTSTGAFTYTSSVPSVATITSGGTITILSAGTAVITANQAAAGSYLAGSITANFVVTAPIAQVPTTAAPAPPTRNAWDVKSIYSGTYSNAVTANFFPDWGQGTTYQEVSIASNPTLHYTNLDYEGIDFSAETINAIGMTKLHLDIYTPDASPILVFLISNNESPVTLTPTFGGWNSFDINLSDYTSQGTALNGIIQLKIVKRDFAYHAEINSVYIDNIYFWRPATASPPPTISGFANISKVVGDSSFALTAPTSNSTGAFSYLSSNTSVATISGSTVTIVGAGISTITATQAASASYGSGVIAATLTVSFPPPATAAPVPTVPADRVLSLFSDSYTNVGAINWVPNWGQSTQVADVSIVGNNTKRYQTLNYQGVQLASPIDVSDMTTLHLDIWTPNCTTFEVSLINQEGIAGSGILHVEQAVSINPTTSGWNSIDIPLSQYSPVALSNIGQLKFVGTPSGTSTVYLDNIYFTKPTPTAVAPTVTAVVNLCKGSVTTPLTASGFSGNALKWYTGVTNATTHVTTYTLIATGAPTPLTTTVASPSKIYYVSQVMSNGVEGPKATITVNVLALPTEVLGVITSNTESTITPGTYIAAAAAVGQYVGTSTAVSYRVPAFADTTLAYYWTVPTGVNIVGQDSTVRTIVQTGTNANVLNVNFLNVASGIGVVGNISVQGQNANGCNTTAKTIALSKVLPVAPAAIKMTLGSSTTAITTFGQYMGTNTVLTLTATSVATSTSYEWELPIGVTQLSGGTSNVITVNFAGVTSSNTYNYMTTAAIPVLTYVLRIGVKSKNGVGGSTTSNATLLDPTTTSTARQLTLKAVKPSAVSLVAGQVAGVCGGSTYSYTITAPAQASAYKIVGPTGSIVTSASTTNLDNTLTTTDLTFSVQYPSVFVVTTATAAADKTIYITSSNSVGDCLTTKALIVSSSVAAIGTATGSAGITTFTRCATQSFTVPAVVGATQYTWGVADGALIASGQGTNSIVVNFSGVLSTLALTKITVIAKNACNVSSAIKTITLTSAVCSVAKVNSIVEVKSTMSEIYPNPSSDNFNLDVNSVANSEIEMTIYTLNGSLVMSKKLQITEGSNTINENVIALSKGIYIVKFNDTSSNISITRKLIKN